jgi:hypothetical protein
MVGLGKIEQGVVQMVTDFVEERAKKRPKRHDLLSFRRDHPQFDRVPPVVFPGRIETVELALS